MISSFNKSNIYNHVLYNLQDYMFNENVLKDSIKYDNTNNNKIYFNHNNNNNNNIINNDTNIDNYKIKIKNNDKFFIPKQNDTLFWCFYMIKFAEIEYELIDKNIINEKKIKIEYVEKIRKNKNMIKKYKFNTLTNIEDNLVNDLSIKLSTFFVLCCIENINIIFINEKKRFYYELKFDDSDEFNYIYDLSHKNKYGLILNKSDIMCEYKNNYYKIDNIDKPIKAMSSYKVEELIKICKLLQINITDNNTNKIKNKKELYESIIQYF